MLIRKFNFKKYKDKPPQNAIQLETSVKGISG